MEELIKKIISTDIEEIINSSISLQLLSCYSQLFLNGGQPRTCAKSQREYYNAICREGLKKLKDMTEKKESTHKCKLKGLKYVGTPLCKHFDLQNMTDEEAEKLLELGFLKKEDFSILPKGGSGSGPVVIETEKDIKVSKKEDLVLYAKEKAYPEDEWKELNANKLKEYLIAKLPK